MLNTSLLGKTAVVCGSTQGIGLASAQMMAAQGASIVLVARNEEKLKTICDQLPNEHCQEHTYLVADFDHVQNVKEAIEAFAQKHVAHILVNNTGGPNPGKAIDSDIEAFRKAFNAHLICNQVMVQALAPIFIREGYGRIINIISTSV
ncbi:MAG: hypothetical protein RLZZ262_2120, partial [Bacteroidota bacterium]